MPVTSGVLGADILDWAQARRPGLSKFVSLGNKTDVREIDLLEAWGEEAWSRVILCSIEGVPDGQAFIEVTRRTSKKKSIVAIESDATQGGARSVSSHTGSLAGSEQAQQAAFRQAGIVRANTLEDLFDHVIGFAWLPLLRGDRIAIDTQAGGPGILATDALELAGLSPGRLTPENLAALKQGLPDAAFASAPVDVLGDARSDRYRFALKRVVTVPNVDALMVILNQVPDDALAFIDETVRPCLKSQAMPIVREVVAILQSDILTRDYNPDPVCERFTIGVMSVGAALARFHRQKNKAASTAGARADNKLAPP